MKLSSVYTLGKNGICYGVAYDTGHGPDQWELVDKTFTCYKYAKAWIKHNKGNWNWGNTQMKIVQLAVLG